MAGGIFQNYPFELNAKCVIFSIVIIGLFFYKPPNMNIYYNLLLSFVLFVVSYVGMAWYDYSFECQKLALKKSSSNIGITDKFKPKPHSESQLNRSKMTKEERKLDWTLINIYHLFLVVPIFMYVGIQKDKTNQLGYILLIINFIFAILYHAVRVFNKFNFISWAHIILSIGGIYYSIKKDKPNWFYTSCIGIAIYTALKHGNYLLKLF
jgi:hypothetical protein